tara:strand:+ start:133 stop:927 length:795 start_codon:yes stop_codon:yes gene_type:complete
MKFQKEKKLLASLFCLIIILCIILSSKVYSQERNTSFFNKTEIEDLLKLNHHLPYHEKYYRYSFSLIGKPYVGNVLIGSKDIEETFIIDLNRLDCFTYVEYVHSLANSKNFRIFKTKVREYRYDMGRINFINRNHFFTDWTDNGDIELVEGYNKEVAKILNKKGEHDRYLEGIPLKKKIIKYFSIDKGSEVVLGLKDKQNHYIVAILSNKIGLDVSHVGFLLWDNEGNAIFRHASSKKKYMKVIDEDFFEYIKNKPGIIIYKTN